MIAAMKAIHAALDRARAEGYTGNARAARALAIMAIAGQLDQYTDAEAASIGRLVIHLASKGA